MSESNDRSRSVVLDGDIGTWPEVRVGSESYPPELAAKALLARRVLRENWRKLDPKDDYWSEERGNLKALFDVYYMIAVQCQNCDWACDDFPIPKGVTYAIGEMLFDISVSGGPVLLENEYRECFNCASAVTLKRVFKARDTDSALAQQEALNALDERYNQHVLRLEGWMTQRENEFDSLRRANATVQARQTREFESLWHEHTQLRQLYAQLKDLVDALLRRESELVTPATLPRVSSLAEAADIMHKFNQKLIETGELSKEDRDAIRASTIRTVSDFRQGRERADAVRLEDNWSSVKHPYRWQAILGGSYASRGDQPAVRTRQTPRSDQWYTGATAGEYCRQRRQAEGADAMMEAAADLRETDPAVARWRRWNERPRREEVAEAQQLQRDREQIAVTTHAAWCSCADCSMARARGRGRFVSTPAETPNPFFDTMMLPAADPSAGQTNSTIGREPTARAEVAEILLSDAGVGALWTPTRENGGIVTIRTSDDVTADSVRGISSNLPPVLDEYADLPAIEDVVPSGSNMQIGRTWTVNGDSVPDDLAGLPPAMTADEPAIVDVIAARVEFLSGVIAECGAGCDCALCVEARAWTNTAVSSIRFSRAEWIWLRSLGRAVSTHRESCTCASCRSLNDATALLSQRYNIDPLVIRGLTFDRPQYGEVNLVNDDDEEEDSPIQEIDGVQPPAEGSYTVAIIPDRTGRPNRNDDIFPPGLLGEILRDREGDSAALSAMIQEQAEAARQTLMAAAERRLGWTPDDLENPLPLLGRVPANDGIESRMRILTQGITQWHDANCGCSVCIFFDDMEEGTSQHNEECECPTCAYLYHPADCVCDGCNAVVQLLRAQSTQSGYRDQGSRNEDNNRDDDASQ